MRAVRRLETDDARCLRASVVLPTFRAFAEECELSLHVSTFCLFFLSYQLTLRKLFNYNCYFQVIMNCLEGQASYIYVSIDLDSYTIECKDNGSGFCASYYECAANDMWNCTSKSSGCRGEALAAMATLGNLDIVSSCIDGSVQRLYTTNFKASPSVIDVTKDFDLKGTVVRVKDIFGSYPVRRKALQKQIEISKIKDFVKQMSILNHTINWTLHDAVTHEVIFNAVPSKSVAARISFIYGSQIMSNMVEVCSSVHNFKISGFVSPPSSKKCSVNKDYQFLYVNSRWVKDCGNVLSTINKAFSLAFSISRSRGPDPKHFDSKFPLLPCFILNITCERTCYDILLSPDKSEVIFGDDKDLNICVASMLFNLFKIHHLDFSESLRNFFRSLGVAVSPVLNETISECYGTNRVTQGRHQDDAFDDAFLSHASDYPNQVSNIPSNDSLRASLSFDMSSDVRSCSPGMDSLGPSEDLTCSYNKRKFENYFRGNKFCKFVTSDILEHKISGIRCMDTDDDLNADFGGRQLKAKRVHSEGSFLSDQIISKDALSQAQFIGQLDQKYILALVGDSVVCIDQHAADERVRLEEFYPLPEEIDESSVVNIPVPIQITLNTNEVYTLEHGGTEILRKWGFCFNMSQSRNFGQILSFPCILGEVLTEGDFFEFLFELGNNIGFLQSVRPPAIKRIYASKACRGAVKFGDCLTNEKCQEILKKLATTNFPFIW